jgi:hypothetical protein
VDDHRRGVADEADVDAGEVDLRGAADAAAAAGRGVRGRRLVEFRVGRTGRIDGRRMMDG